MKCILAKLVAGKGVGVGIDTYSLDWSKGTFVGSMWVGYAVALHGGDFLQHTLRSIINDSISKSTSIK